MKKHSVIVILAAILTYVNFVLLSIQTEEMDQDIKQLQAQVSQLNIEVMQSQHQVRQLWQAQEKLLWVSQDIDQRLLRAEGRNMND